MKISSVLNKPIHITPKFPKENEQLCPKCDGTGWLYIENDNGEKYINKCRDCYDGIITLCEKCGKPKRGICMDRECRAKHEVEEELNRFNKSIKYTLDNCPKESCEMYYSELYDYNEGYDSFLDWIDDYEKENDTKVKYVWGTQRIPFTLDCDSMIEYVLEESYEDAYTHIIKEERAKLEIACDEFVKAHNGILDTYSVDYDVCILLEE